MYRTWMSLCFFALAFALTYLLTPAVMRLAEWLGAVDRGGYRKHYAGRIPLMGGLAVAFPFLGMCAAVGLGNILAHSPALSVFVDGLSPGVLTLFRWVRHDFGALAVGVAVILALGAADDIYDLSPATKILWQALAAAFLWHSHIFIDIVRLPWLGSISLDGPVGLAFSLVWLVGLTNAFNLVDGVDGLAAGIGLIASVSLAVLGGLMGNLFVMLLGATLAGSLAAFLRYNFPPGRIYLGDTGSMFIGFTLAAVALMGKHKSQATVLLLTPVLILGLPIIETVISMARRFVRGQPVFVGDARHTHHRLFTKGLSGTRTLYFLYGVAALLAVAGITRTAATSGSWLARAGMGMNVVAVLAIVWAGGYIPGPRTVWARLSRRHHNRLLDAFARYAVRALSSNNGHTHLPDILKMLAVHAELRYIEAAGEHFRSVAWPAELPEEETADMHRVEAQAPSWKRVTLRFAFDHEPSDLEVEDTTACLGRIFERAQIPSTEAVNGTDKANIIGLGCNMLDYDSVLATVKHWRKEGGKSRYVIALNPHSVMMSRRNRHVLKAMSGAALAVPDGVGMVMAANMLGYSHSGRVTGPTLMLNLCDRGRKDAFRHFLFGGRPGVTDELERRFRDSYPGVQIVGTYSPPFRKPTPEEDEATCKMINDARPDILWVGLGAPKQEQWMADHEDRLKVPVMVGVGAAFDFHSGNIKWAPKWIRNLGAEWAYRLALEPRRMWRRNLDSPLFLIHVLMERLKPPAFRSRHRVGAPSPDRPPVASVDAANPPG